MKGMVFNLLEDFVTENFGDDTLDEIYDQATLQTKEPFVGPGMYPDEDFLELVGQICSKLGITPDVASRKFGEYCFPKLSGAHGQFVSRCDNAKDFIKSVDGIVHVEVLKLYPDVELPKFEYPAEESDSLTIEYRSKKKLCFFMEGLIAGCGKHYNENIAIKQEKCYHQGDDHCLFKLKFSRG